MEDMEPLVNNRLNLQAETDLQDLHRPQAQLNLQAHALPQEAHLPQDLIPQEDLTLQANAHQTEMEIANAKPKINALLDQLDLSEKVVWTVCQESPDWTVFREKAPRISTMNQQRDVSTVQLDLKDLLGQQANLEFEDREDPKEAQDSQEEMATQELRENKEALEIQVTMESQVNQETRELMLRSQLDVKETVVLQDHKEVKDQLEMPVKTALPATLVRQDPQDRPDSKAPLDRTVMKDPRDLSEDQEQMLNIVLVRPVTDLTANQAVREQEVLEVVQMEETVLVIMALILVATRPQDTVNASSKL